MISLEKLTSKKSLWIGLAVFVVLLAGVFYLYRSKVFSTQVLSVNISGSESAMVGQEVEYTVTYKNNGNFALEKPKLVFQLPDYSLTEDSKTRLTEDLPDLQPGQQKTMKFTARLLGKEGDAKIAKAMLSYIPHNLSVRYEADAQFTTTIKEVPITLTYDLPTKIEKGKQLGYSINYFSNIDYPLENLSIRLGQTDGFAFISSNPSSLDSSEYKLDTLEKSKGGRITIIGSVSGETASSLHFSARLGMWVEGVFITIKEVTSEVQVTQPSVLISQRINGVENYSPTPGETLNYQIFVTNTGSTPFNNPVVTAKLNGQAFDLSTLRSTNAQVQGSEVMFGAQRLGSNQQVEINFSVKLNDAVYGGNNATTIKNSVNALNTTADFVSKVSSKIQLLQTINQNSGYTYTVSWQVKNDLNDVTNAKVRALLPLGATLGDGILPEDEIPHFAWDSTSRQVLWLVGALSAGQSKTLSFQVTMPFAIQPSALVSQASVLAEDRFTGAQLQSSAINQ